jgi:hypothetical protein
VVPTPSAVAQGEAESDKPCGDLADPHFVAPDCCACSG